MKFFNNGWDVALEDEFEKDYFKDLLVKVDEEYAKLYSKKLYKLQDSELLENLILKMDKRTIIFAEKVVDLYLRTSKEVEANE